MIQQTNGNLLECYNAPFNQFLRHLKYSIQRKPVLRRLKHSSAIPLLWLPKLKDQETRQKKCKSASCLLYLYCHMLSSLYVLVQNLQPGTRTQRERCSMSMWETQSGNAMGRGQTGVRWFTTGTSEFIGPITNSTIHCASATITTLA